MKTSLQLIAGAALAACTGLALAQISPPPPSSTSPGSTSPSSTMPSGSSGADTGSSSSGSSASSDAFAKLDADKDGNISKKEAAKDKGLTAKWATLDMNKDGKLDPGEFAAFEAPKY